MASVRASQGAFFGVSALLFAASAAITIRLVRVHVGDGRDADARRLDDVDGVQLTPYVLSGGWANCGRTWSDSVSPSAMRDIPAYSLLWLLSSPFLTS
jgi:hypothetical protein